MHMMHTLCKYPNQTCGHQEETHRPPYRFQWLFLDLYLTGQTNVPALSELNELPPFPAWSKTLRIGNKPHYGDVIIGAMWWQISIRTIVCSTVYSDADQRTHQSSASLVFVWGIHRWPVNSPHNWPVTRKMFPFDDVIMLCPYNPLTAGGIERNLVAPHHHKNYYIYTAFARAHPHHANWTLCVLCQIHT